MKLKGLYCVKHKLNITKNYKRNLMVLTYYSIFNPKKFSWFNSYIILKYDFTWFYVQKELPRAVLRIIHLVSTQNFPKSLGFSENFAYVLKGTLHVSFQPGVKFIPGWIQLYLWSKLSSWLHAETSWNFSPTVISTLS